MKALVNFGALKFKEFILRAFKFLKQDKKKVLLFIYLFYTLRFFV